MNALRSKLQQSVSQMSKSNWTVKRNLAWQKKLIMNLFIPDLDTWPSCLESQSNPLESSMEVMPKIRWVWSASVLTKTTLLLKMKKMKLVPYPKEEKLSSKKIGKQRPNTMRPGISISIRVHLRESYGNISEKIKTNQSMLSVWCAQIIPGLATNSSVFVCLCRQKNHYLLGQINDPSSGNILFSVIPFNNSLVLV